MELHVEHGLVRGPGQGGGGEDGARQEGDHQHGDGHHGGEAGDQQDQLILLKNEDRSVSDEQFNGFVCEK